MKKELEIKPKNILIILGILVAILIGISTQWAVAGDALFGSAMH